jgi:iron(III) transport system permease protein
LTALRSSVRPARYRAQADPWPGVMLAVVVAASVVILSHLLVVVWLSITEGTLGFNAVFSTAYYRTIFTDPFTFDVLLNTLGFSFSTLVVALAFGVPIAWIAERTDLPCKILIYTLMTVGLVLPGFTTAMGWMFLLNPKVGVINVWLVQLLGLDGPPFAITSVFGMGWVQGLNLASVAFVMTAATFRAMDPALEEAAHMSGAGFRHTWLRITMRLAWPGILAASIFVFTMGFAAFDVPAVIGLGSRIFTFSTYILVLLNPDESLPKYGTVAALSAIVLALAGGLSWWYGKVQKNARRYAVVTGKAYRPRITRLGGWVWAAWGFVAGYFVLSKLLPLLVLIWVSLLPFVQPLTAAAMNFVSIDNFLRLDWQQIGRALSNTGVLMVLTPTVALILALCFSWIVLRSKIRGRSWFDFIAFLPHAVPNIVFAVAALLLTLFMIDKIVPIYGTLWVLLLVFVVGNISYATRMTNSGLIQINRELDESAHTSGANTGGVMREVLIPLLTPTMIYAWLWMALLVYRELTMAVLLSSVENTTLPMLIWNAWQGGSTGVSAALALLLVIGLVPLIAAYWYLARRKGLAIDR